MPKLACHYCGCENEWTNRSREYHNGIFAFLSYAYHKWPGELEFQPDSPLHLRKWCLWKIGHHDVPHTWHFKNERERKTIMPFVIGLIEHYRRLGIYSWGVEHDGGLSIQQAASMSELKADGRKFNELAAKLTEHIYHYTGIDWNKWIAEGCPRRYRDAA